MRYTVIGADKETGNDIEAVLVANTHEEAELIAIGRGILVASIEPLKDALNPPQPPASTDPLPEFHKPSARGHITLSAQAPGDSAKTYDGGKSEAEASTASMEYHIISNQALYLLETAVNKHIKEGWEPQGSICVGISNNALQYFQAMIRRRK